MHTARTSIAVFGSLNADLVVQNLKHPKPYWIQRRLSLWSNFPPSVCSSLRQMSKSFKHSRESPRRPPKESNRPAVCCWKRQAQKQFCVKRAAAAPTSMMAAGSSIFRDTPSTLPTALLPEMPLMVRWLWDFRKVNPSRRRSAWPMPPARCASPGRVHSNPCPGAGIWIGFMKPKNRQKRKPDEKQWYTGSKGFPRNLQGPDSSPNGCHS